MKLTDEMCNAHFAQLPIDLKRYLVNVCLSMDKPPEGMRKFPKQRHLQVHSIYRSVLNTREAVDVYRSTKKNYYHIHRNLTNTAAYCLNMLLTLPELPWPPKAK